MERITRDRRLTPEEVAKYNKIREQVAVEFPKDHISQPNRKEEAMATTDFATDNHADLTVHTRTKHPADLMLVKLIRREPTWRLQIKGAKVQLDGMTVQGKHTSPQFKLDVHPIFAEVAANTREIGVLLDSNTIVDPEDGFRLISAMNAEKFIANVARLNDRRVALAEEMDRRYEEILNSIFDEHPEHVSQLRGRIPTPPFRDRMELVFSLRPLAGLGPEDLDFSALSFEAQQTLVQQMQSQARQMAEARVQSLLDGVVQPVIDLAQEINGEAPNPNFDETKPEGPSNRRFKGGINSGHKREGFLDTLTSTLERVMKFGQFMDPGILASVQRASEHVQKINGAASINSNVQVQQAIAAQMRAISDTIQASASDVRRRAREVLI